MKYFKLKDHYTAYVDVDETLILWKDDPSDPANKILQLENGDLVVKLHKKHIQLVKNLYTIGWNIIIWSQGGSNHAEAVIKKIGLENYIHAIIPKPTLVIDDKTLAEQGIRRSFYDDE